MTGAVRSGSAKRLDPHRHQEFLKFLKTIDRATPNHLDIHGIAAAYATHQKQEVKDWLAKQPRFHFHFIPPSSARLTLVERWFGSIPEKRIRRGMFKRVGELERAIYACIEPTNANPKPYRVESVGAYSSSHRNARQVAPRRTGAELPNHSFDK